MLLPETLAGEAENAFRAAPRDSGIVCQGNSPLFAGGNDNFLGCCNHFGRHRNLQTVRSRAVLIPDREQSRADRTRRHLASESTDFAEGLEREGAVSAFARELDDSGERHRRTSVRQYIPAASEGAQTIRTFLSSWRPMRYSARIKDLPRVRGPPSGLPKRLRRCFAE